MRTRWMIWPYFCSCITFTSLSTCTYLAICTLFWNTYRAVYAAALSSRANVLFVLVHLGVLSVYSAGITSLPYRPAKQRKKDANVWSLQHKAKRRKLSGERAFPQRSRVSPVGYKVVIDWLTREPRFPPRPRTGRSLLCGRRRVGGGTRTQVRQERRSEESVENVYGLDTKWVTCSGVGRALFISCSLVVWELLQSRKEK